LKVTVRRSSPALIAVISAIGFIQIASAADWPVDKAPQAPFVRPAYDWTGGYVGLNLGGSWGQQGSNNLEGIIGGGQVGYNWQADQWIFGFEADFQGSGQKVDGSFFDPTAPTTVGFTNKLDWFGTVRVRMGYALDYWLPYVTGGLAYGHSEVSGTMTVGPAASSFSNSQDYQGWTIGGGLEWAFANNWRTKVEYLYINFGDGPTVPAQVATSGAGVTGKMTDNIVRVGVNYKFW
jgi:outer membrane immunogenic protein